MIILHISKKTIFYGRLLESPRWADSNVHPLLPKGFMVKSICLFNKHQSHRFLWMIKKILL